MAAFDQMKSRGETDAAIDRVDSLLHKARPVPLTDQVRLRLAEAQRLVSELREALAAERRERG